MVRFECRFASNPGRIGLTLVLRRGGKGAKERATLEKMTRIKKNIRQFRSENQNYYKSFMSKLANVAQNLKTMHDGSHMGVAQSQVNLMLL